MKKTVMFSMALGLLLVAGANAQNQGGKETVNGVVSQQGQSANSNTSSVEGMKRRGSGKMAAGATRNGNSNLSPTGPTNTQGSTSRGMSSKPSAGGAPGTRVTETRQTNNNAPKSTKNGTASDGGLTSSGTPRYGTKVDQASTSGSTGGSKRPTSAAGVQKEARTNDKNVSTGYPQPTGAGKPGTPSGKPAGGGSYPQTGKNQ